MLGVATKTKAAVAAVDKGWGGKVAATRKTTPGFAVVEKYGVLVGGGATHRFGLSQSLMIKDNHLWAHGGRKSLRDLIRKAKGVVPHTMKIEVEARDYDEAVEAATEGADIVMLDNFSPERLAETAKRLKAQFPALTVEASGGITLETIQAYAVPGVDVVSMGSLTYGYGIVDFSMKLARWSCAAAVE